MDNVWNTNLFNGTHNTLTGDLIGTQRPELRKGQRDTSLSKTLFPLELPADDVQPVQLVPRFSPNQGRWIVPMNPKAYHCTIHVHGVPQVHKSTRPCSGSRRTWSLQKAALVRLFTFSLPLLFSARHATSDNNKRTWPAPLRETTSSRDWTIDSFWESDCNSLGRDPFFGLI